jgi:hypothetical protein
MTKSEGTTNVEVRKTVSSLMFCQCFVIRHSDFDIFFAPGVTRTPDLRIRNPLLYPAELRAQLGETLILSFVANESRRDIFRERCERFT